MGTPNLRGSIVISDFFFGFFSRIHMGTATGITQNLLSDGCQGGPCRWLADVWHPIHEVGQDREGAATHQAPSAGCLPMVGDVYLDILPRIFCNDKLNSFVVLVVYEKIWGICMYLPVT